MSWYLWHGEQLIIKIRVQPKASRDEIVGPYGEEGDTQKYAFVRPLLMARQTPICSSF